MNEPRAGFCWECGKPLRLPHFVEQLVDGHMRILHNYCSNKIMRARRFSCVSVKASKNQRKGPVERLYDEFDEDPELENLP